MEGRIETVAGGFNDRILRTIWPDSHHIAFRTHGTVQYFPMHFTASVHTGCHTGGHTPLSLQSRSSRDGIKNYFDQSGSGARLPV